MCLGVPMQVTSLSEDGSAVVEFEGTTLEVRLDICDQRPAVGDYVIVHAGYAIHWIDPEEAKATQDLFRQIMMSEDDPEDDAEDDTDLYDPEEDDEDSTEGEGK
jgi:hydrogenase expression/formation protein HypC